MKTFFPHSQVVLALALGVLLSNRLAEAQDEKQGTPDKKLESLLAERRDTLRTLADNLTAQYRAGVTTIDNAIRARHGLLSAELDIADTHAKRIDLHKQSVKNLHLLENEANARLRQGASGRHEVLTAKAARLAAEIELLREERSHR